MAIINHLPRQQTQKIKKIYTSNYVLFCTKIYQEKYGIPATPEELQQHLFVAPIPNSVEKHFEFKHLKTGATTIIKINPQVATNNAINALQMIFSNEIIVGQLDIVRINSYTDIIQVLPEYSMGFIDYYMIRHPNENNMVTKLFCDFIEELLKAKQ